MQNQPFNRKLNALLKKHGEMLANPAKPKATDPYPKAIESFKDYGGRLVDEAADQRALCETAEAALSASRGEARDLALNIEQIDSQLTAYKNVNAEIREELNKQRHQKTEQGGDMLGPIVGLMIGALSGIVLFTLLAQ